MFTRYQDIQPFTTRDHSTIRELMHPAQQGSRNQSLAEAIVAVGTTTLLHRHLQSEELYHITAGEGVMQLGEQRFSVSVGDTILIPPATPHAIQNSGDEALKILCCCAPPYSHEDTELL